jgi:L-histidine Nalpha-methyltransferase
MTTLSPDNGRVHIRMPAVLHSRLREDVALGLQQPQKAIPPKYFYDHYGSQLFEQICQQPEYYLTRTEATILKGHATDILDTVGECSVVELGSGSAVKTRLLLDESTRRGYQLHYVPIDISESMLRETAHTLSLEYPQIAVDGLVTDYTHGLAALPQALRRLVLFLGSNLGNFTLDEQRRLFRQVAAALQPNDYFLLGLDLRKPIDVVEAAYNDAAGVTAAFNLNLLRRVNRELRADFNLSAFSHLAFYHRQEHQIEMHLRSEHEQQVNLSDIELQVAFRTGETIHTEISRKFDLVEISAQLAQHGFQRSESWTDARGWFAVSVFRFTGEIAAQS